VHVIGKANSFRVLATGQEPADSRTSS
jgi:hypothetical protein